MNVHLVQLDIVWEDAAANHRRVRELLAASPPGEGSLVVLPEMFASGFSMNVAKVGEPVGGPSEMFVCEIAKTYRCHVIAGIAMAGEPLGANEAIVASPAGGVVGRYRKINTFTPAGETSHYARGTQVEVLDIAGVRVAPFICYDLRFPEVFRIAAARGAELMVVIANWPEARVHHWTHLLVARAIENQAYVIGVNRCGRDLNLAYSGQSLVVGPRGEVLLDAGDVETVAIASFNLVELRSYRDSFPILADLRFAP